MDEPTNDVDPQSRKLIFDAIHALAARGASILFCTHHLIEAESLCDEVIVLQRGRVVANGTMKEVVDRFGSGAVDVTFASAEDAQRASEMLHGFADAAGSRVQGACIRLKSPTPGMLADRICGQLKDCVPVRRVRVMPPSLEAAFFELTENSELPA
jgi:ABC-2 type transport system ATP-binding protein